MARLSKRPAAADRRLAKSIFDRLDQQHPNANTELHFRNPYELLVATILSAQCTDARVNQVTPALFARYPDAAALARATTDELEPQIQSTGFFRMKSRALVGMAQRGDHPDPGGVPDVHALDHDPVADARDHHKPPGPSRRGPGRPRRLNAA